jgi:hypothetical protein
MRAGRRPYGKRARIIRNVHSFRLEFRGCDQRISEQDGLCHVDSGCDLSF